MDGRWAGPRRRRRRRVRVEGVVQGVGFRPFVHRLASELQLGGFVRNDARGVEVEVEGPADAVERVPRAPARRARRRWRASRRVRARDVAGARRRAASRSPGSRRRRAGRARRRRRRDLRRLPGRAASTPPTAATATRSSTARTAARASRSCAASPTTGRGRRWPASRCAPPAGAEYDDPPTAASTPSRTPARPAGRGRGWWRDGRARRATTPSRAAAALLRAGAIVAVKGLGGYHLACRADDDDGGRAAARAQAPRGQAVRADGAPTSRRRGRSSRSATRRWRC